MARFDWESDMDNSAQAMAQQAHDLNEEMSVPVEGLSMISFGMSTPILSGGIIMNKATFCAEETDKLCCCHMWSINNNAAGSTAIF